MFYRMSDCCEWCSTVMYSRSSYISLRLQWWSENVTNKSSHDPKSCCNLNFISNSILRSLWKPQPLLKGRGRSKLYMKSFCVFKLSVSRDVFSSFGHTCPFWAHYNSLFWLVKVTHKEMAPSFLSFSSVSYLFSCHRKQGLPLRV